MIINQNKYVYIQNKYWFYTYFAIIKEKFL